MPCFILSMKMKLLVKYDNRSIRYNNFYEYHNLILPFCLCPGLKASSHVCLIFRSKASVSVPGGALCFAGVGYDPLDLALYKFMPKKNQDLILAENDVLIAGDEKYLPHPVTRNISLSTASDSDT